MTYIREIDIDLPEIDIDLPKRDRLSDVLGMLSEMMPRYTVKDRSTVTASAMRSPQSAGKMKTRTLSRESMTTGIMVLRM